MRKYEYAILTEREPNSDGEKVYTFSTNVTGEQFVEGHGFIEILNELGERGWHLSCSKKKKMFFARKIEERNPMKLPVEGETGQNRTVYL